MFTGIVESLGEVKSISKDLGNITFEISSQFIGELKIDQSIAHNGICLTITELNPFSYMVTAIHETLIKTNLQYLNIGDKINLERCLRINDRFDGHIVQGHIDQVGICFSIVLDNGSWIFAFQYESSENITVEKGSITVNGISLTVINSKGNEFSVAIIPFTYHHTMMQFLKIGDVVNLEFDILGKYIKKILSK